MNLEQWSNVADIVAAIAIVITLGYLAVQIRHSTDSTKNSTSWAITQALFSINGRESSDGEFTELWIRGLKNYDVLNEVERERFRAFSMDLMNLAHYLQKNPVEEHAFYVPYVAGLLKENPGFRRVVEDVAWSVNDDLRKELRSHGAHLSDL